ncbi:MAG: hypothetical protein KJO00_06110 [Bacteroidia bacterium]|nr:hypothetical protein [Bacteroidia bacterium]
MEQNKTGKYFKYAIGEIILVVIGILIALQVNNWNIKRIERTSEIKYLNNIKLDLQKDLASLTYQIDFRREKYDRVEKLIAQINGQPVQDIDELAKNVFFTLMEERFTPNRSTYNELASSGNLNLISNDSIKKLLLELEELYKYNNFGIDHEMYEYREYISKPLFKYANTDRLIPVYDGEKTAREQDISLESFQGLFQSPEYKNGLVISNLISKEFIPIYENIQSKSEKIIELIDEDIE